MNRKLLFLCIYLITVSTVFATGWLYALPAFSKGITCENKGAILAQQGKLDEAIAVMNTCVTEKPSSAKSHVALGFLYFKKDDLQLAMASFDRALELRPRSSGAKVGKGIVLSKNGDLNGAEKILKEGLKLNPEPSRAHYELGLIYEQQNDLGQALLHYKKGISTYEKNNR